MHVRSSFVTNSSSSSFVMVSVKSKLICNILEEFQDELNETLQEFGSGLLFYGDDTVEIYQEEGYCELPSTVEGILECLAKAIDDQYAYDCYEEDADEATEKDYSAYSKPLQKLMENREAVLESIEEAKVVDGEQGWQGDSECRYNEEWYESDTLAEVQADIMDEHGYSSVDEITDEDFCDYVGDKVSIEENVVLYDRAKNEFLKYRTTELEG